MRGFYTDLCYFRIYSDYSQSQHHYVLVLFLIFLCCRIHSCSVPIGPFYLMHMCRGWTCITTYTEGDQTELKYRTSRACRPGGGEKLPHTGAFWGRYACCMSCRMSFHDDVLFLFLNIMCQGSIHLVRTPIFPWFRILLRHYGDNISAYPSPPHPNYGRTY